MNIVPRFLLGGSSSLFTVFNSVKTPLLQAPQTTKTSTSDSQSLSVKHSLDKDDKDDTKGKLTEKDLFAMIKDVDGLPNEMKSIVNNLKRTLDASSIAGISPLELSSTYLDSLYKLKVANQNKKLLDASVEKAKENGTLEEAAITVDGLLMVTDKNGSIGLISFLQYQANPENYQLLTNSNLAWLRKYSPKLAFKLNDDITNTISNGMSYEVFLLLLDKTKTLLGSYKYEETGVAGKEALLGLKALSNLSKELLQQYLQEALDGRYSTESSSDTNAQLILALVSYLTITLPKRAKIWASLKTNIADPNKATYTLVAQYLQGQLKTDQSYKVQYLGTDSKLQKAGKGSGGKDEDPKEGFWQLLLTDKAGTETTSRLLIGKGEMSVDGKYYGTTPGLDSNKSLSKYIGDSNVGYLIKNTRGIMFGDLVISPDSFNDIMVNSGGGALAVTLPVTADGKVNFDIMDSYSKVINALKKANIPVGTEQYEKVKATLLKKMGMGYLVDASTGKVNTKYFGHFLVLEGVASDKAYKMTGNQKRPLELSQFLVDASSDDLLFDSVREALSSKDKEYDLDNNWWAFNNNKLYKGNIYIPINTNLLNGANADKNDVKSSTSQRYEYNQLIWDKMQRQRDTSLSNL